MSTDATTPTEAEQQAEYLRQLEERRNALAEQNQAAYITMVEGLGEGIFPTADESLAILTAANKTEVHVERDLATYEQRSNLIQQIVNLPTEETAHADLVAAADAAQQALGTARQGVTNAEAALQTASDTVTAHDATLAEMRNASAALLSNQFSLFDTAEMKTLREARQSLKSQRGDIAGRLAQIEAGNVEPREGEIETLQSDLANVDQQLTDNATAFIALLTP